MIRIAARVFAIVFACSLLVNSKALAIPVTDDYWTVADLTTLTTDSGISTVDFGTMIDSWNFFAAGGKFGFYDFDDPTNTLDVLHSGVGLDNSVYFTTENDTWSAGLESDLSDQSVFNQFFGFFFSFLIDDVYHTFYSDSSLNGGTDYITIDYDPYNGTIDFNYGGDLMASVGTDDIAPAPVPEPSTVLLFGTGIAGLAGIWRKKNKKEIHT